MLFKNYYLTIIAVNIKNLFKMHSKNILLNYKRKDEFMQKRTFLFADCALRNLPNSHRFVEDEEIVIYEPSAGRCLHAQVVRTIFFVRKLN
jgi:hypothetical protein